MATIILNSPISATMSELNFERKTLRMYHGRSIGRCLEWLRRIAGCVDYLRFGYPDGSIRIDDEVVIRRVTWDFYDTPTFSFVDEDLNRMQEEVRGETLTSEHNVIHHQLDDAEIEALESLKKEIFFAERIRMSYLPDVLCPLVSKGLAERTEKLVGWDDDEGGTALYWVRIEISPQALGFLRYLHESERRKEDSP
jgi:hypothetical protein